MRSRANHLATGSGGNASPRHSKLDPVSPSRRTLKSNRSFQRKLRQSPKRTTPLFSKSTYDYRPSLLFIALALLVMMLMLLGVVFTLFRVGTISQVGENSFFTLEEWSNLAMHRKNFSTYVLDRVTYKIYRQTPAAVPNYRSYPLLPASVINPNVIIRGHSYDLLSSIRNANTTAAVALDALLPLPAPIIVVGMPKAGTSSITTFFRKLYGPNNNETLADKHVSHWRVPHKEPWEYIGLCLIQSWNDTDAHRHRNLNHPPTAPTALQECGNFSVWAQMDICRNPYDCHFPQITHLDHIHREYPNATFILNRRHFGRWYSSVQRWMPDSQRPQGNLAERLARCADGPLSPKRDDVIQWHKEQIERVRYFVWQHPTHALLEVDIEDGRAGDFLAKAFRGNTSFWEQTNKNANHTVPPPSVGSSVADN